MKYTPFKSLPLLLSLSRLLGAFANVSVLNYAPGRTWYRAAAVGVPCTSKNPTLHKMGSFAKNCTNSVMLAPPHQTRIAV